RHDRFQRAGLLQDRRLRHPHRESRRRAGRDGKSRKRQALARLRDADARADRPPPDRPQSPHRPGSRLAGRLSRAGLARYRAAGGRRHPGLAETGNSAARRVRETPMLDNATRSALERITTATLTTVLLKKGLRNVWLRGARPLTPQAKRIVGEAFTLRFVPAREELAPPESRAPPKSTRGAIEAMPEGCIAVVDAVGVKDAGIFGDILCARMRKRGVAALVTDGVVRDGAGVIATGLP